MSNPKTHQSTVKHSNPENQPLVAIHEESYNANNKADVKDSSQDQFYKLLSLLQLEFKIKHCNTTKALEFLIVNELKRINFNYKQAIVYSLSRGRNKLKATTASGVNHIDQQSSLILWNEKVIHQLNLPKKNTIQIITIDMLSNEMQSQWKEFNILKIIWVPLIINEYSPKKFLWLSINQTFLEKQLVLLEKISHSFAYAFEFLEKKPKKSLHIRFNQKWSFILLFASFLISFLPVRLSTLAPAEIIAQNATIISAPLEGVIKTIYPKANSTVQTNQPLIKIDDTQLSNELALSQKNLSIKLAQYQASLQGAFTSLESKSKLTFLKQEVALAKAEVDYIRALLQKTLITAPYSGIILFNDPQNMIGKPIQIGQSLMELADPNLIELKIQVPIADAIILKQGSLIKFFLDSNPMNPIKGTINYSSYYAYPTETLSLAYHVIAQLDTSSTLPRIGLSGTCKIFGEKVSLAYYLFRKPIAFIRTKIGL